LRLFVLPSDLFRKGNTRRREGRQKEGKQGRRGKIKERKEDGLIAETQGKAPGTHMRC